jgi:hypothetical protein
MQVDSVPASVTSLSSTANTEFILGQLLLSSGDKQQATEHFESSAALYRRATNIEPNNKMLIADQSKVEKMILGTQAPLIANELVGCTESQSP